LGRAPFFTYHGGVLGQVASGINNIFHVRVAADQAEAASIECRIMGKVLGGIQPLADHAYNPLAPGDWVEVEVDAHSPRQGWILERRPRTSAIRRWNRKRQAPQTIAANVDRLAAVGSFASPPFRPRFLDRLLLCAELGDADPVLVINKEDLGSTPEIDRRVDGYREMGYEVITCSADTGSGIAALGELLARADLVAVVGQSGVGKSALLNRLDPAQRRAEGELSRKYDRGAHTTRYGEVVSTAAGVLAIDTPGIRELEIADIEPHELRLWYRDFLPYVEQCEFPGCLCTNEPGCAVRAALARGDIQHDRHRGYLRVLAELKDAAAARR
jgi:ribosome biogenesis GTPase